MEYVPLVKPLDSLPMTVRECVLTSGLPSPFKVQEQIRANRFLRVQGLGFRA